MKYVIYCMSTIMIGQSINKIFLFNICLIFIDTYEENHVVYVFT